MVTPADKDPELTDLDSDFEDFDDLNQDMPLEDYDDTYDDLGGADIQDAELQQPAATAKPKKKTSLFTIGVIAVAVIVGGIIMVGMFSGSETPAPVEQQEQRVQTRENQPPENQVTDPNAPDAPVEGVPTVSDNAVPPDTTSLQGLQALDQQQMQQGMAPVDTQVPAQVPVEPQQGFMNNPDQLVQTPPAVADGLPVPQADDSQTQNLPQIDQIKKADAPTETSTQTPSVPVTDPVAAVVDPTVPSPAVTNPVVAQPSVDAQPTPREIELQAKLDETLKKLEEAEQKIAEAAPAPTPEPIEDTAALKAEIERLNNKVAKLEAAPVKTPAVKKASAKPKKSVSKPSSASGWKLRSAQPGQALIAKPDGNDLKLVRIGDQVVGIGQVSDIFPSGGKWVIQGTSGRISE